VSLAIFPRPAARLTTRPSSRDGLYALASAWQASTESNVRPFTRPAAQTTSASQPTETTDPAPFWPDGPSAA
jgi:hypothetical protein